MSLLSPLTARLHNWLVRQVSRRTNKASTATAPPPAPPRYSDINLIESKEAFSGRRALVQFATHGFDQVLQGHQPAFFNPYGATVEMVRALNELGFKVDLIDTLDADFTPTHPYDVFVGHGPNYARVATLLPPDCRKVRYSTGSHVKSFLKDSQERYQRFRASRGLPESNAALQREVNAATDYSKVDLLVTLGERTAASYSGEGIRATHVHNAAYVGSASPLEPLPKHWEKARKNFIYVSGTNGNIQKGLDLLLEAFAGQSELHLYLYSKLDQEILDAYGHELALPNIHYVYHYAKLPLLRKRLFRHCAFTICAGINTGQSTAYLASLYDGFIPVYNADMDIPLAHYGVMIARNDPEAIREAAQRASRIEAKELERQSIEVRQLFLKNHQPSCFRESMKQHVRSLIG